MNATTTPAVGSIGKAKPSRVAANAASAAARRPLPIGAIVELKGLPQNMAAFNGLLARIDTVFEKTGNRLMHAHILGSSEQPLATCGTRFLVGRNNCLLQHGRDLEAKALWYDYAGADPDSEDAATPYESDPLAGEVLPEMSDEDDLLLAADDGEYFEFCELHEQQMHACNSYNEMWA